MCISILALSSHGDVQPYVTLGKGLQDNGHRVRLVSFENFQSLVEGQGLDFHPVKGDAQALMNSTAGVQLMGSGKNLFSLMRNIMQTFGTLIDHYVDGTFQPDSATARPCNQWF